MRRETRVLTVHPSPPPPPPHLPAETCTVALAVLWSRDEPQQVGEVALFAQQGRAVLFGRGPGAPGEERAELVRQRPGLNEPRPPVGAREVSRRQLCVYTQAGRIEVERVGSRGLLFDGKPAGADGVPIGTTLEIEGQILLACVVRPPTIPPLQYFQATEGRAFGEPDRLGFVGESPAMWAARDRIAWAAGSPGHVLVTGGRGAGKRLAARAVHALSTRRAGPLVTPVGTFALDESVVEQARGGTLVVDDLASLGPALVPRLNRVMAGTETRLVVCTTAPERTLPQELRHRFTASIDMPPMAVRVEDIPLLVRAIVLRWAQRETHPARRFVYRGPEGRREVRIDPALIEALVRRNWDGGMEELEGLVERAMSRSDGEMIGLAFE
jgi:hypothetical protein